MKRKILTVFGTRPEAIKMGPLVRALAAHPDIDSKVAVTAQHREMLDQVMNVFSITPDYDLDIMRSGQDLYDITSRALLGLRDTLDDAKPDLVLVHGDTTTCFAAALAAFYQQVPVGHVEAGLRTGNMFAPYPEEANRSLVGRLAELHFAPTEVSRQNLLREGIQDSKIEVTGNTVIDALLYAKSILPDYRNNQESCKIPRDVLDAIATAQEKPEGRIILITGHRRENFGQGFKDFCAALAQLAKKHPDWLFIYPVHLNPNVQKPVFQLLSDYENICLIEPQGYLPFVWLLNECDIVITDSGGIQEEAPSLGKPVLVTRKVTERPEAVTAGTVRLVGTSTEEITKSTIEILTNGDLYQKMSFAHNPYGDGNASKRIIERIQRA